MRCLAALATVVLASFPAACGKDANTQLCLDDFAKLAAAGAPKGAGVPKDAELVHQTCAISCDVAKDHDACNAWQKTTEMICDGGGKETCRTLCSGDGKQKNEHACKKVATM